MSSSVWANSAVKLVLWFMEITPSRLLMLQQLRQFSNVRRNAPGLVAGEEVRRRATVRLTRQQTTPAHFGRSVHALVTTH